MQIVYIPSESMSVQGKKDEIYKRYGKDWNIREQGKSKLTAKLVDKFREDVANGKIKL